MVNLECKELTNSDAESYPYDSNAVGNLSFNDVALDRH